MKVFLMAGAAALVLAACGSAVAGGVDNGKGAPQPAATAVTVPMPTSDAGGALTAAQVTAVAEQTFPLVPAYGYYAVCGVNGDTTSCPYTPRLKARLAELRDTLMRAQNPSDTRSVAAEVTGPSTGVAHVTLFGGRQSLDLSVVSAGGTVLVDDEVCAGRPGTSLYKAFSAC